MFVLIGRIFFFWLLKLNTLKQEQIKGVDSVIDICQVDIAELTARINKIYKKN